MPKHAAAAVLCSANPTGAARFKESGLASSEGWRRPQGVGFVFLCFFFKPSLL